MFAIKKCAIDNTTCDQTVLQMIISRQPTDTSTLSLSSFMFKIKYHHNVVIGGMFLIIQFAINMITCYKSVNTLL